MFRLLADENFDGRISRGVRLRFPSLDLVHAKEVGLEGADDPAVLAWAANEGRVLITHDAKTMPDHVYHRLAAGERVPGVILVRASLAVGAAIDDILLILNCCREDELDGQVYKVPI
jgi:predicted nuclease of predicted toxin-antitoxin system